MGYSYANKENMLNTSRNTIYSNIIKNNNENNHELINNNNYKNFTNYNINTNNNINYYIIDGCIIVSLRDKKINKIPSFSIIYIFK